MRRRRHHDFAADLADSAAITLEQWRRRSLAERALPASHGCSNDKPDSHCSRTRRLSQIHPRANAQEGV
jgi:hypothetical protein